MKWELKLQDMFSAAANRAATSADRLEDQLQQADRKSVV